jgi:RNA polymerase sigma factor (sigma-70 family)
MTNAAHERVARALRDLGPQVLGIVVRRHRDFAAAEDAVQEALLAAATQWPRDGWPERPRAWLVHVALRRLADHVRAETARARREEVVVCLVPPEVQQELAVGMAATADDTLQLLWMCCDPALSPSSAVALTLRAVGGLTTAAIARAFMVPEATMAQRIARAKQTIRATRGADEGGGDDDARRHELLLRVVYLVFNEGYVASDGPTLRRDDLAQEAIRLARILHAVRPDDGEVAGLLALMLLTDARRAARTGPDGELVPLDEQDRSRWDRALVAEGTALVAGTLGRSPVGPYQIQAAIAALHDEAASTEATDWPQIAALYERLAAFDDGPMVRLSHAIAIAMVEGPRAGLARIEACAADPRLREHYRVDAARAHLFERAGDVAAARALYERAAQRTTSIAERNYLALRAARLGQSVPAAPRGEGAPERS